MVELINEKGEKENFIGFIVTGILTNGKKFKTIYSGSSIGYNTAMGINLFKGSVWAITTSNKKKLIKRIN